MIRGINDKIILYQEIRNFSKNTYIDRLPIPKSIIYQIFNRFERINSINPVATAISM
jgi:hypothetical protein